MASRYARIGLDTFVKLAKKGRTKRKQGKVNWEAVFEKLKRIEQPIDVMYVHEVIIEKQLSRFRVKSKLDEMCDNGFGLKFFDGLKMWYLFHPQTIQKVCKKANIPLPENVEVSQNDIKK